VGLFAHIKNWLSKPLTPNADMLSLVLYVGIVFAAAWLWASVIGGITRIEGDLVE
jgi:hypothetical protein